MQFENFRTGGYLRLVQTTENKVQNFVKIRTGGGGDVFFWPIKIYLPRNFVEVALVTLLEHENEIWKLCPRLRLAKKKI